MPESTGQGDKSQGGSSAAPDAFGLLVSERQCAQCVIYALVALIHVCHSLVTTQYTAQVQWRYRSRARCRQAVAALAVYGRNTRLT